jgi:hypothetical protein
LDTEPKLTKILKGQGEVKLPPELESKLNILFDNFHFKDTDKLVKLRQELAKSINTSIAESIKDFDKLEEIIRSIKQNASKGSIFSQWIKYHPEGKGLLDELPIFIRGVGNVILDSHYYEGASKIGVEVKYLTEARELSGHAVRQMEKYGEILSEPSYGINFIEYIFNTETAALKNQAIIERTLGRRGIIKYYKNGKIATL